MSMSDALSKQGPPNRMLAVSLDDYIRDFIDGYLDADIRTMIQAQPSRDKIGAVGYPLVVTVSTGIEALGRLFFPKTKKGRSQAADNNVSKEAFLNYWQSYMTPRNASYRGRGDAFYAQVRSGIVHYYLAKGELFIIKGAPELHMTTDPGGHAVFLDAVKLAEDYFVSVDDWKRWLGDSDNRRLAEANWATIAAVLGEAKLITELDTSPLWGKGVYTTASGTVNTRYPPVTGGSPEVLQ
jgi:hypothetical protein